jgi:hypothetical protein
MFLILKVKVNDDKSAICIEGNDINPIKKLRLKILPANIPITQNFWETIERNWDFFSDSLTLEDQVGDTIEFEVCHLKEAN